MKYLNFARRMLANIALMYICLQSMKSGGTEVSKPIPIIIFLLMCVGLGWVTEKLDKIK